MSSFVFRTFAINKIIQLSKFEINLEIIGSLVIPKLSQKLTNISFWREQIFSKLFNENFFSSKKPL